MSALLVHTKQCCWFELKQGLEIIVVMGALLHGMALAIMFASDEMPLWTDGAHTPHSHISTHPACVAQGRRTRLCW